jgi:hypothetical protein
MTDGTLHREFLSEPDLQSYRYEGQCEVTETFKYSVDTVRVMTNIYTTFDVISVVSCWFFATEAWIQSRDSPPGICGGHSGTREGFSPSTSCFQCQLSFH